MSVRPPAPGPHQQYPRPAGDPGTVAAIVGLVMFFVVALPIFVIGTAMELNPVITLSSTTATLILSVRAFCTSKRYGHTNVIAVITMTLCLLLLMSALVSTLIRLLLIL